MSEQRAAPDAENMLARLRSFVFCGLRVPEPAGKAHPEDEHRDAGDGEAQAELEDLHPKFGLCQVFGHHPAPPLQSQTSAVLPPVP